MTVLRIYRDEIPDGVDEAGIEIFTLGKLKLECEGSLLTIKDVQDILDTMKREESE